METKTAISANELMLGNWVMYGQHRIWKPEIVGKYHQIKCSDFDDMDDFGEYLFQPIPLSAELLEKVEGCETLYKSAYTHKWDIEFDGRHICVTHHVIDGQWGVTFGSHIVLLSPYLHTLQNVIFLNWGKELEITL